MARDRSVKLGRKMIPPAFIITQHWAVKVGDFWYELGGLDGGSLDFVSFSGSSRANGNEVNISEGRAAMSGAGSLGGEIVGVTNKTDEEINVWIHEWKENNPEYRVLDRNCQNFAYEFIVWLTDGVFECDHLPHMHMKAKNNSNSDNVFHGFAIAEEGNAIASFALSKEREEFLIGGVTVETGQVKAQAVAGPGLGLFVDAKLLDLSYDIGNVLGFRVGVNFNTGVGARNGNLEGHFLGWGGKAGADGVEINSPFFGVRACSLM